MFIGATISENGQGFFRLVPAARCACAMPSSSSCKRIKEGMLRQPVSSTIYASYGPAGKGTGGLAIRARSTGSNKADGIQTEGAVRPPVQRRTGRCGEGDYRTISTTFVKARAGLARTVARDTKTDQAISSSAATFTDRKLSHPGARWC